MAKIGAKYPCFLPAGASAGLVLGKLNQANVTINTASGDLYGDDMLAEHYSEFSDGNIAMETTHLSDENATAVFGHTATQGRVVCKTSDLAPEGKFAYYRVVMVGGAKSYKFFGYPRVRARLGNESDQTKNNQITFSTDSLTLDILAVESTGEWREFETFATEAAAISAVNTFCSIAASSSPAS